MKPLRTLALNLLITLMASSVALGQSIKTCPMLVQTALDNALASCEATGRNQACYGNALLEAEPQPGVESFDFDRIGDRVDAADIRTLRLSAMDVGASQWGVALMEIQANIPDAVAEDVTLLLFGDVQIENNTWDAPTTEVETTTPLNIRRGPSLNSAVVGSFPPGRQVMANGRLEDKSWVRILMPNDAIGLGWMSAFGLSGTLDTLDVVAPTEPIYGPMQAFTFTSGADDAPCDEAPSSGLLIQTPEGVGEVRIVLNQVAVRLGSTVYFEAQPGKTMTISVFEGRADVTAYGVTRTVPAGAQVSIPLTEDAMPAGAPEQPQPYDAEEYRPFTPVVAALPQQIAIATPAAAHFVTRLNNFDEDSRDDSPPPGPGGASVADASAVGNTVAGMGSALSGTMASVSDAVSDTVDDVGALLGETVSETVGTVGTLINGDIEESLDTVGSMVGNTVSTVAEVTGNVTDAVNEAVEVVEGEVIEPIVDETLDTLADVPLLGGLFGGRR